MAKAYTLPFATVLYDMSFANVTLYSAIIPEYKSKSQKGGKNDGKIIKVDDPRNRDAVLAMISKMD